MAAKTSKTLAKDYPDFKEVHYLNGMLLFSNQNYGKSVTEFNQSLKSNPANSKALYNRSIAFGLMEEYLSAIEDLDACIQLNPTYVLAYYSRGYWYEFTGNYTEAAKDYEKTIQLDPTNYDAYLGAAYCYQNLKQSEKACEILNQAIKAGSQVAIEIKEIFCK
jgi:tetratricopeptide (TPR) repeat protein